MNRNSGSNWSRVKKYQLICIETGPSNKTHRHGFPFSDCLLSRRRKMVILSGNNKVENVDYRFKSPSPSPESPVYEKKPPAEKSSKSFQGDHESTVSRLEQQNNKNNAFNLESHRIQKLQFFFDRSSMFARSIQDYFQVGISILIASNSFPPLGKGSWKVGLRPRPIRFGHLLLYVLLLVSLPGTGLYRDLRVSSLAGRSGTCPATSATGNGLHHLVTLLCLHFQGLHRGLPEEGATHLARTIPAVARFVLSSPPKERLT